MDEQDVKSLAVKLAAVTDRIEKRMDGVARETMRASQAMGAQAQQSLAASEQVSAGVRRAASHALDNGASQAIDRFGSVVRASEIRLEGAAARLEQRMLSVGNVRAAWVCFSCLRRSPARRAPIASLISVRILSMSLFLNMLGVYKACS